MVSQTLGVLQWNESSDTSLETCLLLAYQPVSSPPEDDEQQLGLCTPGSGSVQSAGVCMYCIPSSAMVQQTRSSSLVKLTNAYCQKINTCMCKNQDYVNCSVLRSVHTLRTTYTVYDTILLQCEYALVSTVLRLRYGNVLLMPTVNWARSTQ